MSEMFINAANRVYIRYYSLVIAIVIIVAIGTPVARYLTGDPSLELVPDSLYTFIIEVGKPIVFPVVVIVLGPLMEPATKFLIAYRGGKIPETESDQKTETKEKSE